MRLFVCEFITGGGLLDAELPAALAHEGDMMLHALVSDLLLAGYDDILCTRDPRLAKLNTGIEVINPGRDVRATWRRCMAEAETVWIIAPETGNVLYELTCMAEAENRMLLGCSSSAVQLTTSKSATIRRLLDQHIPTVPVIETIDHLRDNACGWVIKPDDGAGAEGCCFFSDLATLKQHIRQLDNNIKYIVQEYIQGIPASISMLCYQGEVLVLACNRQLFDFEQGKGHLNGIVVNGLHEYAHQFESVANMIGPAIDGLSGYVGVDLVMTEAGPQVLEINPRLTTAYAGLRESLGVNPAAMILSVMQTGQLPDLSGVNYMPVTLKW